MAFCKSVHTKKISFDLISTALKIYDFYETFSLGLHIYSLFYIAEIQNSKSIRNDKNYKKGALGHRKDNTRLVNRSDWLLNKIRRIRLHNILWRARGRESEKSSHMNKLLIFILFMPLSYPSSVDISLSASQIVQMAAKG
jgi:hypothetical protein